MRLRRPQKIVLAAGAGILLVAAFLQAEKYEADSWLALACFLSALICLVFAFARREYDDGR
jgi:hypothetical protein